MGIVKLEKMKSFNSKMWKKTKWSQPIQISVLAGITAKNLIILKIPNCSIKCSALIINYLDLSLKQMASAIQNPMNGMYFGHPVHARVTFMKVLMNTRKSIISLKVMKSPEKIVFVTIWSACRKSMESKISISYLTLTSFLMSSVNFMPIIKNLNNTTQRKMFGS